MSRPKIPIPEYWLNEKIERAMIATRDTNYIEKLFLVIPVPLNSEGETEINTKYGKLKVFFCNQLMEFHKYECSQPKILLLSSDRFNYPKISKVSARPFKEINGKDSHLTEKKDEEVIPINPTNSFLN